MTINFCGKLNIDKSFYSLKQSNCKEIAESAQKLYDNQILTQIIPDTTFFGKGSKKGDMMTIKFGDYSFEIVTKGEVTVGCVLHQLLLNTCFVNNKQPISSSFKYIKKAIVEILDEKFAKEKD